MGLASGQDVPESTSVLTSAAGRNHVDDRQNKSPILSHSRVLRLPGARASRRVGTWIVAALASLILVPAPTRPKHDNDHFAHAESAPGSTVAIDPRRSLVVTEQPILARFPYQRVVEQLVAQSGVPGMTALRLHQQWWDTQNPGPGLGLGPHCDDYVDHLGDPVLNGFPYTCRLAPSEGAQAGVDPFLDPETNPDGYVPIALFNRFDLAPADGAHCGEYRIVFAKRSGMLDAKQRNLVIFEPVLPNRHPQHGLNGCKKVAEFWADLSREDDLERRADLLERFFFEGIHGMEPAVHVDRLGGNLADFGQIRTNQFVNAPPLPVVPASPWSLREFKLVKGCDEYGCPSLTVVPVTDKVNSFGPLFSPTSSHPQTAAFQEFFPSQVAALATGDLNEIDFDPPEVFNSGQSQASGSSESRYLDQFGTGASHLRQGIQDALDATGSVLTPDEVVLRAQALSCAGCHRLNNNVAVGGGLVWPSSLGFTHVTERVTETVGGVTRWVISPALLNVFLPKRKQILEEFLMDKPVKVKKKTDPIGGRRTH